MASNTQSDRSLPFPIRKLQIYASITKGFTQGVSTLRWSYRRQPARDLSEPCDFGNLETGVKTNSTTAVAAFPSPCFYIDVQSFNDGSDRSDANRRRAWSGFGRQLESYGVEVDASYPSFPELVVDLSGGYNRVRPPVLSADHRAGCLGNVGEQFQRAPKWSYRLAATYTQPLSDDVSFELNGAVNGVGSTHFCGEAQVFGPCPTRNAYTLVDASASIVWSRYRISLFAKNLLDKTYATDFLAGTALAQFGAPSAGSVYGDPRYWGVRASAKF